MSETQSIKGNKDHKPEPVLSGIGIHLKTPLFAHCVSEYIDEHKVGAIIETGTHNGTGSSKIFAATGLPVHTCEVNRSLYLEAEENLSEFGNVKCSHAHTLDREDCDLLNGIRLRESGNFPMEDYWLERTFDREIELLEEGQSILVFLDTHWTLGFQEFRVIFDRWCLMRCPRKVILVLDDCNALKHRPAMRYLKENKIDVPIVQNERWAIIVLPNRSER